MYNNLSFETIFKLWLFLTSSSQISTAAAQLVQYCQEHSRSDPLLTGISASSNPFKDKKTCVLL
jgi:hypothetical protein